MVKVALFRPSTKASTISTTVLATVTDAKAWLPKRLPTQRPLTTCIDACSRLAARIGSEKTRSLRGIEPLRHRLIRSQPYSDGSELDECEVVVGVFFVSRGDGAEVLEFVEEALDEV